MRACYGKDDIRVGAALHNMAGLYLSTKPPDFDRAESILREALDVSLSGHSITCSVDQSSSLVLCCDIITAKVCKSCMCYLFVFPVQLQKKGLSS